MSSDDISMKRLFSRASRTEPSLDDSRELALAREVLRRNEEIERLRAENLTLAQDLFFMSAEVNKFAGENYEQYCEIKQLRVAGDALATNLERIESIHHPRCAPNIAGPARIDNCACLLALAAWQEARRER